MFLRTYPGAADLTVGELQERLNSDGKQSLIRSIQRSIDWIPGLSPFWNRHRRQLTAMIEQIGSPHIFFTLSAADLHWPELHRIIEEQRAIKNGGEPVDIATLSEADANKRRVQNLTQYPHIVASFLQSRVKLFLDSIRNVPGFEYVDYWYRFEWQHRGSGHVHGFLWLNDGPDLDKRNLDNPQHRDELCQYFGQKIFAKAPIPDLPKPASNPCQLSAPNDKDNQTDVTELLNRCQRHTKCLPSYCLRFNKRSRQKLCRFGFPQSATQDSKIDKNEKGQWTFYPARPLSDSDLNRFHPLWTAMWRGNIDISAVLSKEAAINYISKYAVKAETLSKEWTK